MDRSPLATLAALAVVAVVAMALLWLFSLRQVTDTSAAEGARAVDVALARNLVPGQPTRVTVTREGAGPDAARDYVIRLHPTAEVAAAPEALADLAQRAAQVVAREIERTQAAVRFHVIAEVPGGTESRISFARLALPGAGGQDGEGGWELRRMRSPPVPDSGRTGPSGASPAGKGGR